MHLGEPIEGEAIAQILGQDAARGGESLAVGRGERLDRLQRFVENYHRLKEQIADACAEGRSDEAILDGIEPPEEMRSRWRFVEWKHRDTVRKLLTAARRGSLST